MALTDTFVRLVKPGKPGGVKHTDGAGMYLLVKETGKYWRMNYRFLGKRKTLALGVYPEVSLATARKRRDEARKLLAEGIDSSLAKQEERNAKSAAACQPSKWWPSNGWRKLRRPAPPAHKGRCSAGWTRTSFP